MSENSDTNTLEIIEVPEELRGPSDEEIIKMSEKPLREVSGKRKKGERRPSKRRRQELREEKAFQEAQDAARELLGNSVKEDVSAPKPQPAHQFFSNSGFTSFVTSASFPTSPAASKPLGFAAEHASQEKLGNFTATPSTEKIAPQTAMPSSGRVLKASFGGKFQEKPKAVIVSAAELAKQRAEERAKKIREALLAKRMAASAQESSVSTANATAAEGSVEIAQPVKRPRGRPRKNPIVSNT